MIFKVSRLSKKIRDLTLDIENKDAEKIKRVLSVRFNRNVKIEISQLIFCMKMCSNAQFHFDSFDDREDFIFQSVVSMFPQKFIDD